MRFFLFLLANALLFIRPSEFIAELNAIELYRYFILACLAVSLPVVLQQFSLRYAGVPPIVACVLLLLPAICLSGLYHGDGDLVLHTITEFVKILIYFLLLITLVTDLHRLRQFLYAIGWFSAVVTLIAVLRYHTDIAMPAGKLAANPGSANKIQGTYVVDEVYDPQTGNVQLVNRMCGTGIFNDPNDLALVLVTAIPMALYWLTDATRKAGRPFWLILLLLCGYALTLTHSRGGFLALLAGLVTLIYLRYGVKKTILLTSLFLPVLFILMAGRMTSLSTEEGTAQSRIQLWSDGLMYFQHSPLFGIGMDNYPQFSSHVAHNSFIHCFTELGMLGGTLFLGAFYFAIRGLYLLRQPSMPEKLSLEVDPELRRLHPFLMAMLVAYTVGICFLSRSYIVPTYMMLGLSVVYLRLHAAQVHEPVAFWKRFVWPRLTGVSFGFLIASYSLIRVLIQWH